MQTYVRKNQKLLRQGLTTGTCAAMTAKAAAEKLLLDREERESCVQLPNGERVAQPVFPWDVSLDVFAGKLPTASSAKMRLTSQTGQKDGTTAEYAGFYTLKDAGDDPDVTNGTRIAARAFRIPPETSETAENTGALQYFTDPGCPRIRLFGGRGVGHVTKSGLKEAVGEAAINPVPRKMIFEAVSDVLERVDYTGILGIEILVPEGEALAARTFNPMLGIEGGISILGTSGIVEPMSERAIVDTIEMQLRQEREGGAETVILVPGNYGERYVREMLRIPSVIHTVQCSNFIGESLDIAATLGFSGLLLVGNVGKLAKLAAGIMNTHSRYADGRWEIFGVHAALQGASAERLEALRGCVTSEEMLKRLGEWGLRDAVVQSIFSEMTRHVRRRAGKMPVYMMMYSEEYGLLAASEGIGSLLKQLKA